LRDHAPGLEVILFADEEALATDVITDALGAGALDLFLEVWADQIVEEKLRKHVARLYPGASGLGEIKYKSVKVDLRARRVHVRVETEWRETEPLGAKEFEVLCLLVEKGGDVVSREELLDRAWPGKADQASPASVDKYIASLRKKLLQGTSRCSIETLRGVGFGLKDR